jgi:hypothetical protein
MAQVCDAFCSDAPAGYEIFIVRLTVQNMNTVPTFYYDSAQVLAVHGQQVSIDNMATSAAGAATGTIQPSMSVSDNLAYVIPKGAQPEAILLSDMLASISNQTAATRVELP